MPYRLPGIAGTWYKPGERQRREAGIVWRGWDAVGKRREIATLTTDQTAAKREVDGALSKIARSRIPEPGEAVSLRDAATHYRAGKDLSGPDNDRLDYIIANDGDLICSAITQATVAALVNKRRSERVAASGAAPSADTLTRDVVALYRAVMRYAHFQGWAPLREFPAAAPMKGEAPKPPRPTAKDGDVSALLEALEHAIDIVDLIPGRYAKRRQQIARERYAFVLLVHERGYRCEEWLRLDWSWLDLQAGMGRMLVTKPLPARWLDFDLSPDAVAALAALGPRDKGRVFRWKGRSAIYQWADMIGEPVGVRWRPHESRRAVVSAVLRATGDIKLAAGYVGHKSEKTTLRYRVVQPGEATTAVRHGGARGLERKAK